MDNLYGILNEKTTHTKLLAFIENHSSDLFITGGISEDKIIEIEQELLLDFSCEYRNFLAQYGMLLGYGVEILGCGKSETAPVVTQTKRFRQFGLSNEYIVIRNADEWIYCLNNNDGTVSSWEIYSQNYLKKADSFDEYILEELFNAKKHF